MLKLTFKKNQYINKFINIWFNRIEAKSQNTKHGNNTKHDYGLLGTFKWSARLQIS